MAALSVLARYFCCWWSRWWRGSGLGDSHIWDRGHVDADESKRAAYDLRVHKVDDAQTLAEAKAEAILAAHDAIEKRKEQWMMQIERARHAHSEAHASIGEPKGCVEWARQVR